MANSIFLRDLVLTRTLLDRDVLPALYIGLHEADPSDDGMAELAGRGYARQPLELQRAAAGLAINSNAIEYKDLPKSLVSHFSVWDGAGADGRYLTGGPLMAVQDVNAGQSLRWNDAELLLRVG